MILGTYSGATYEPVEQPKPQRRPHRAKVVEPAKPMCGRCGMKPKHALGRCVTCTKYWDRYGVERPYELIERARERMTTPLWCKVCGCTKLHKLRRCRPCHRYWKITGKERPSCKWNHDAKCLTCGFPKHAHPEIKRLQRGFQAGRCGLCNHYLHQMKRERPERLWGKGIYGFCMCGRPANHQKDGFNLCAICADD